MVGIANENAIFLYVGVRDPKAGAIIYWLPVESREYLYLEDWWRDVPTK